MCTQIHVHTHSTHRCTHLHTIHTLMERERWIENEFTGRRDTEKVRGTHAWGVGLVHGGVGHGWRKEMLTEWGYQLGRAGPATRTGTTRGSPGTAWPGQDPGQTRPRSEVWAGQPRVHILAAHGPVGCARPVPGTCRARAWHGPLGQPDPERHANGS